MRISHRLPVGDSRGPRAVGGRAPRGQAPAGEVYVLGTCPRVTRPSSGIGFTGDSTLAGVHSHAQGCSGRRRGCVPQADGAGWVDPAARGRAVDLPARRLAGRAQGRGDHPRGDGGDRLPGDADAGAAAGGELGEERALRDRRAVQARGPQGVADGAGDDARGGGHLPRGAGGALLPRPAADALPHPDEGARRAAATGRGAAHARVHDEGRLLLRPRRGGSGPLLRAAGRRLRAHPRSLRVALVQGRVRRRDDGWLRRRRVHGALRRRRERGGAGARLRRQRRGRRGHRAGRSSCRRRWTRPRRSRPRA